MEERYYTEIVAAFVRGRLRRPDLSDSELISLGLARDLRLHRFKVKQLPRVSRVLGILKGLAPTELLDIGCGRGTFLWPLLDAFPALPVTTIDLAYHRVRDVADVRAGGVARVRPVRQSVLELAFTDDAFHTATALEVLEHLETPSQAARELLRVARCYIVASVPSKDDDNPEHIQLFSQDDLESLFLDAGARGVQVNHVLNHRIAVVKVGTP